MPTTSLLVLSLNYDFDLFVVRRRARQLAAAVGLGERDQTAIGTVAAELGAEALRRGRGGRLEFCVERDSHVFLVLTVSELSLRESEPDAEPSSMAEIGALMDAVAVSSGGKARTVVARKRLSGANEQSLTDDRIEAIRAQLSQAPVESPLDEMELQNTQLLRALAELTRVEARLAALERQLDESSQGSPNADADQRVAANPTVEVSGASGEVRLLLIDDDEVARYALARFASRPGLTVVEAVNGQDGIAKAQQSPPDVIFLDLGLPGIGGHEVLQKLADDSATARIPVVIITSRFLNDAERREILGRAAEVIYKSDLSHEVVSEALDRVLAVSRPESAVRSPAPSPPGGPFVPHQPT